MLWSLANRVIYSNCYPTFRPAIGRVKWVGPWKQQDILLWSFYGLYHNCINMPNFKRFVKTSFRENKVKKPMEFDVVICGPKPMPPLPLPLEDLARRAVVLLYENATGWTHTGSTKQLLNEIRLHQVHNGKIYFLIQYYRLFVM